MSKVRIDSDEWYPVYSVRPDDKFGHEVEVAPERVARWAKAQEAFEAAQAEMSELWEAAEKRARDKAEEERAAKESAAKAERERVADERRVAVAEREAQRATMWRQIEESGGYVYDAHGQKVGRVMPVSSGVSTGIQLTPEP